MSDHPWELAGAIAAVEKVTMDTLAAENRALHEQVREANRQYEAVAVMAGHNADYMARNNAELAEEIRHLRTKLEAAQLLSDQAIRENERLRNTPCIECGHS